VENILWRMENGELDGVDPKVIVLHGGTNNVGSAAAAGSEEQVVRGMEAILGVLRAKAPRAVILLTAVFPRNDNMAAMPVIQRINQRLVGLADGKRVRFLSINGQLADKGGKLKAGMMNERDKLHPTLAAYEVWAQALKPVLTELLGPPAQEDLAPPPTGDPSAKK
jgi:lysophospholipase L1-like esterase